MNIPFRNIRQLLSLQAKVAPDKVFLKTRVSHENWKELTYAEFNARAHQAANLLHTDFGVKAGDVVAIIDDHSANVMVLLMACWLIGAVALPCYPDDPDELSLGHILTSGVSICLIKEGYVQRWKARGSDFWREESRILWESLVIIELGNFSELAKYPCFYDLARNLPNTFLGDEPEPTLDSPALSVVMVDKPFTQRHLLTGAQSLVSAQSISGNHRLLGYRPIGIDEVTLYLAALMTGAAIITSYDRYVHMDTFWRMVAAERLHIVDGFMGLLSASLKVGLEHKNADESIYGAGVYQQDINQLRHIICWIGMTGVTALEAEQVRTTISDFTNLFGIMALTGFISLGVPGYCTLMPIDLTWPEYRRWMFDHDGLCVGCPLDGYEIGIMDGGGNMLKAGERGKLCVWGNVVEVPRYKQELDGWLQTHQNAYYLTDERGRQFVYLLDNPSPIS